MKIGTLIVAFVIWSVQYCTAQNCSCTDNYAWLKEVIKENDAGFQYAIDQRGAEAYKRHCDSFAVKIRTISDKEKCAEALMNWLGFFRKGHLWIELNNENSSVNQNTIDSVKVKERFSKWESFPYDENEFQSYLSEVNEVGLEGVWISAPYTIGIKRVKDEYIGFIIEADEIYWSKNQIKFKIKEQKGQLSATYYMKDHSARELSKVELLGSNYLRMDFIVLKRKVAIVPAEEQIDRHFKFMTTEVPIFEKLSNKTAILRIPSFSYSEKKLIDSIIDAHWQTITRTENLLIDLRNNSGGSDKAYEKLLPIIYSNPIKTIGMEFYSTTLNNKRMLHFMNDPEWSVDDRIWAKQAFEKLNDHIGEFVNLDSTISSIETFDSIYSYPQKVGILINENCASSTEQFLLAAKQSKKVKLFGNNTFGSLDISNMNIIDSPCEDLKLGYALSKSLRIPDMSIDGQGIQPDYYINNSISKYDWIEYVNSILN